MDKIRAKFQDSLQIPSIFEALQEVQESRYEWKYSLPALLCLDLMHKIFCEISELHGPHNWRNLPILHFSPPFGSILDVAGPVM